MKNKMNIENAFDKMFDNPMNQIENLVQEAGGLKSRQLEFRRKLDEMKS